MKMVRIYLEVTQEDRIRSHRKELQKLQELQKCHGLYVGNNNDTVFIKNLNPSDVKFWYPGMPDKKVVKEKKSKHNEGGAVTLPNLPKIKNTNPNNAPGYSMPVSGHY